MSENCGSNERIRGLEHIRPRTARRPLVLRRGISSQRCTVFLASTNRRAIVLIQHFGRGTSVPAHPATAGLQLTTLLVSLQVGIATGRSHDPTWPPRQRGNFYVDSAETNEAAQPIPA